MITFKDVTSIGSLICSTLKEEQHKFTDQSRHAVRSVAAKTMENIYYSLPDKTRSKFDFEVKKFFDACNWPD